MSDETPHINTPKGRQRVRVKIPSTLVAGLPANCGEWLGSVTFHVEIGEDGFMPSATAFGECTGMQLGIATAVCAVMARHFVHDCANMHANVDDDDPKSKDYVEQFCDVACELIDTVGMDNVFLDGNDVLQQAEPATPLTIPGIIRRSRTLMEDLLEESITPESRGRIHAMLTDLKAIEQGMKRGVIISTSE